jgi:hypothetical protein
MKLCYIDFEYNRANEARRNLISVVMNRASDDVVKIRWLHNDKKEKEGLKKELLSMRDTYVFVAFGVEAEAGSFISLGLNPAKFNWIDLRKEWQMLTNHNDKFGKGEQLISKRVVKTSNSIKKRELPDYKASSLNYSKAETGIAAAAFKLCGIKVDNERKTAMRDVILTCDDALIKENKSEILDYNEDDVNHLPPMWKAIKKAYKEEKYKVKLKEVLFRGETAAHQALIECRGYPVAKTIKNFAWSVPNILKDCAEDINSQFPDMKIFEWNKARGSYTLKQKPLKDFIRKDGDKAKRWLKTPSGDLSLGLDAWAKHYSYRSPYPRDILPSQIIRYLRLKQSLNGFLPKGKNAKNRETFFDSMGSDYRVRPFLGSYGSQSGRYQPKATSYIPLKASWLRYFIQPKAGTIICGIDYKSQEFLIAALLSGDIEMVKAYISGDVYLAFGKKSRIIPADADKSHPLRDVCKQVVLAIQYLMGSLSLANALSEAGDKNYTEEDAQKYINAFEKAYPEYTKYRIKTIRQYKKNGYLKLQDGWVMGPHNHNHRSVANCGTQGSGSCVLRLAIKYCHEAKLKVILPLHDALYVELKTQEEVYKFQKIMIKAFCDIFPDNPYAKEIMLDTYCWGKDVDTIITDPNIHTMKYYLEPRSIPEFERFKKYFLGEKS